MTRLKQHDRIMRDRAPGPGLADENAVRKSNVDYLFVGHHPRLSSAWDGSLDRDLLATPIPHTVRPGLTTSKLARDRSSAPVVGTPPTMLATAILEKDFAVNDEELAADLYAIAAPVRNEARNVVAALNLPSRVGGRLADCSTILPIACCVGSLTPNSSRRSSCRSSPFGADLSTVESIMPI
jgi:hypothetical protein